jgi:NADPH2:quinone reductase
MMKYPITCQGVLPDKQNQGKIGLEKISIDKPKAHELLIKVHAVGVNRADLDQAKGAYPPPADASPVLGLELSGTVVDIGDAVTRFNVGDKVMSLVAGGAYAEFAIAPEETTLSIPENIDFVEAAAIPEAFFTVWYNVFEKGNFQAGELFLIHGGASGVGSAAIQIVKAMGGKVITTVSSNTKKSACSDLGADHVINYKTENFFTEVLRLTQDQGVDVILDWIGANYLVDHLKLLRKNGRLLCIDSQDISGNLDFDLLLGKCLTISGTLLRPLALTHKAEINEKIKKHLLPKVASSEIKPLIYRKIPLSQALDAHNLMSSNAHIGKIILTI